MAGNTTTDTFSENIGRLNKDEIAEIIRQNEKIRFEKKKSKRKWEAWNKFKEMIDSHNAKLNDENVKSVIGEYAYDILSMGNSKAIEWLNKEGLEADLKDIERMEKDQDWLFTALIKKPDLQTDEVLLSSLGILGAKIDRDQKDDSMTKSRFSLASLGFRKNDGNMKVVIPRNTETPIKKVITLYQTQYPITLDVYEGEKEMANENNLLGTLVLVSPKPTSTGDCLLEVTFIVDKNNGVQVIARDTKSDILVAKTFSNDDCRLNMNAISMMILENENMSFEQKKAQKKREAFSDIEAYVNLLTHALKDLKARIRLGGQIYDVLQKANDRAMEWLKSAGLEAELNDLIKMKEDHGLIINALRKRISL